MGSERYSRDSNKKKFIIYLRNRVKKGKKLSEASIKKYTEQSYNKIKADLGIDIYDLNNLDEIRELRFKVKDMEKGMSANRMYSSLLSNYLEFKEQDNVIENSDNDFDNDLDYIIEVERTIKKYKLFESTISEDNKPAERVMEIGLSYRRSPEIAAEALRNSNYRCEIDCEHKTFISKSTEYNYVEAHHIIPISFQNQFDVGIDCEANIVALCPNCHRKIHFGKDDAKERLLKVLWEKRVKDLNHRNINIEYNELLKMYRVDDCTR